MRTAFTHVLSWTSILSLCGLSLGRPQGNRQVNAAPPPTVIWTGGPGPNWPIKTGLVSFGDSYSAGIGTGTTSGDKCRVGENNYPKLLSHWTSLRGQKIDFQSYVCSGDTTKGIKKQIDKWTAPLLADVATLSVGGNDVDFGELIRSCILNGPARLGFGWRADCKAAQDNAYTVINARGEGSFYEELKGIYKKILDKSGRKDFRIFQTGYVEFFDALTNDCDKSTFTWNWEAYDPPNWIPDPRYIFLLKQHRADLNKLVLAVNGMIETTITDFNSGYGRDAVKFVNVNPIFKETPGHQFCATEDVHEPNPGRKETWFFARSWPDHEIDEAANNAVGTDQKGIRFRSDDQTNQEKSILLNDGKITLPDAATCHAQLGEDPDPYAVWMCWVAAQVASTEEGKATFDKANLALKNKEIDSKDIGWFLPTAYVKMFHPRSDGQITYRNQLIQDIQHAYDVD